MTIQVAITLLKSLEQSLDDYCELNDEGKTAFSMAITALELFGISEQLPSVHPELSNNSPELDIKNGELISRQAIIAEFACCELTPDGGIDVNYALDFIKALPSAQPRKGKWMPDNTNYYDERYICSECNANYKVDTCMGKPSWNFCPNCGSYNGGDSDEKD